MLPKLSSLVALCASVFILNLVAGSPIEEENNDYLQLFKQSVPASVYGFGMHMLHKLAAESAPDANIITSPVNAYAALLMLHLGAGEKTRKDLSEIMKLPQHDNFAAELHEIFGQLLKKIEDKSSDLDSFSQTVFTNGLFVQEGRRIHDSYIQSLNKYYKVNASNLDFAGHTAQATEAINHWISTNTKERIVNFYENPLSSDTVAVLVSALYFNGKWQQSFCKNETKIEKFNTGLAEIEVPMMRHKSRIPYISSDALQFDAIEIPYKGGEYAMAVVLPRPNQTVHHLLEQIHALDPKKLSITYKMTDVDYKMPKIKFSWKKSLVTALELRALFASADWSAITPDSLTLSDVIQAAEIEVDEEGTIASAVTAVDFARVAFVPPPLENVVQFYVDRPFFLHIVHKPTQLLLFSGKVHKPI